MSQKNSSKDLFIRVPQLSKQRLSKSKNKVKISKRKSGQFLKLTPSSNDTLFRSTGHLPSTDKRTKKQCTEVSEFKNSSKGEMSTSIFKEGRPNGQYYGAETVSTHKHYSSVDLKPSHHNSKKFKKTQIVIYKLLNQYRQLQIKHSHQLSSSGQHNQTEIRRLRRIQDCEMRVIMQAIVAAGWKVWC